MSTIPLQVLTDIASYDGHCALCQYFSRELNPLRVDSNARWLDDFGVCKRYPPLASSRDDLPELRGIMSCGEFKSLPITTWLPWIKQK